MVDGARPYGAHDPGRVMGPSQHRRAARSAGTAAGGVIRFQLSAFSFQLSAFGFRLSAFSQHPTCSGGFFPIKEIRMQNYRNLKVWQKAHQLALQTYALPAYLLKPEAWSLR